MKQGRKGNCLIQYIPVIACQSNHMACYFLKIALYLFPKGVAIMAILEVRTKKRRRTEIKIFTRRGQRDGSCKAFAALSKESYLVPSTNNCL